VDLSEQELSMRAQNRLYEEPKALGGLLEKYALSVGSAHLGAVTHGGVAQHE
jgi:hypothetical protein